MRKILFLFISSLLTLFAFTPQALAQNNFRSGEVSKLDRGETVENDFFASGEKVILSGTVNGDAFLAGGNIVVDGVVNGDLLVAGGNIDINGTVNGNIRAAGGNLEVSGTAGKNITLVGGNISVQKNAKVNGNLSSAGGNIKIYAPVAGKINIGGGDVTLASSSKDTLIGVGSLTLTSTATISGNLAYWSNREANISKDASISGEITHSLPPRSNINEKDFDKAMAVFRKAFNVFNFLSLLLIGTLLVWAFPKFSAKAADSIATKPWVSLGFGFMALFLIPLLVIVLLITLIGLPLGLLILALYVFMVFIAKIFTAILVGQKTMSYLNKKVSLVFEFLIGLIIITALTKLPVLGGFLSLIVVLLGLGGLIQAKVEVFKFLKKNHEV